MDRVTPTLKATCITNPYVIHMLHVNWVQTHHCGRWQASVVGRFIHSQVYLRMWAERTHSLILHCNYCVLVVLKLLWLYYLKLYESELTPTWFVHLTTKYNHCAAMMKQTVVKLNDNKHSSFTMDTLHQGSFLTTSRRGPQPCLQTNPRGKMSKQIYDQWCVLLRFLMFIFGFPCIKRIFRG